MNKTRAAAAAVLLTILVAGCAARMPAPGAGPRLVAPHGGWVARTLARMTVEEKIGQMVAIRFTAEFRNADSAYLRELESLVVDAGVGGMILFAPAEVRETARLANAFQKLAKVPILMASDFERGAANRVTGPTLFPPLMSFGAAGSEEPGLRHGADHRPRRPGHGHPHDLRPGRRRQHRSRTIPSSTPGPSAPTRPSSAASPMPSSAASRRTA